MTQYQFTVNGQSNTGALTWNANGTLGQLAITDALNSANAQTCNYSHDDLVRIASANCGSAAAQTFSYDPFGNLNKFGSPYAFQPTYSSSTNRMTSLGTFTPTYDNDGNLLSDNIHTYAWDSYGRPITMDGIGLTYDALGRMVEQNRSGAYTQFVYSPTGFKMQILNGPTVARNFVPLPGGATAVYTPAALVAVRHPDWLGSSRFASTPARTVYYDGAYAPFGEPYAQSGTTDLSFTGMNSDTTSNVYDFLYREYSNQGRWPSPDPAGLSSVNRTNPQSWNRYAYALNNPLVLIDPRGLKPGCYSFFGPSCGGGSGGFGCSEDGIDVSCGMVGTNGNTIFDAIRGTPGTYIQIDIYGNVSFGWSYDLYAFTLNTIDSIRQGVENPNSAHGAVDPGPYPSAGFQTLVNNYGTYSITSGIMFDLVNNTAEFAYLHQEVLPYLLGCALGNCSIPTSLQNELQQAADRLGATLEQIWQIVLAGSPALTGQ